MLIPIPIGTSYTATADGAVWKVVDCAHCRRLFAYQMARSVEAGAMSVFWLNNQGAKDQALDTARQSLVRKLERDFDAVPCPQCGKYQEFMFARIRWTRWLDSIVLGALPLLAALLPTGVGYLFSVSGSFRLNPDIPLAMRISYGVAIVLAVVGLALIVGGAIRARRYDPNNAIEMDCRMRDAASKTVAGDALQRLLQETLIARPKG